MCQRVYHIINSFSWNHSSKLKKYFFVMIQVEDGTRQTLFYRIKFFSTKPAGYNADLFRICLIVVDQVFPVLWTFRNNLVSIPYHFFLYLYSFCRKFILVTLVDFTNMSQCMKCNNERNLQQRFQFSGNKPGHKKISMNKRIMQLMRFNEFHDVFAEIRH